MFKLSGKTALVTGSSRGLGKGIAIALAKAGADVIVNYNNAEDKAIEVKKQIEEIGAYARIIKADVSDINQVKDMFSQIDKIDILINNAGTSQDKDIFGIEKEDWDKIIKNNLTSGFLCSKCAMEVMKKQKYGRIIFISSVVGERGALFGHVHYAATKSGQIGMTKTLARTGAPYNITVNAIAPGIIATDLLYQTHGEEGVNKLDKDILLGIGTCEDIGAAAVYLASDEARYITGATLDVNGGANFR